MNSKIKNTTHISELLKQLHLQYLKELTAAHSTSDLLALRTKYLGRKGIINVLFKQLALLDAEPSQKRELGLKINALKDEISSALLESDNKLIQQAVDQQNIKPSLLLDLTLPGSKRPAGSLHLITLVLEDIVDFFKHLGFQLSEKGTEIDTPYYNFDALNVPVNHPARSLQDTFYINDNLLLRTHTSGMQIKLMEQQVPPIKIISFGSVYRPDSDSTHTPMFHQVEGVCIDQKMTMSNLFSVMEEFIRYFFGSEVQIRRRPSYFPFTRPSAEFDIKAKNKKWIEILGCGMIHPYVLKNLKTKDNQSDKFQGFAFGIGLERLTMLKYGLDDIRVLFENDLRFLRQFKGLS